jgi:hypothetical protein
MNRYLRIPAATVLTVMVALSTTAWAGAKGGAGVSITFTGGGGSASGTMGNVRNSADTVQFIGCTLSSGPYAVVSCTARNTSGTTVACSSAAHEITSVAHAMTSDAHIQFSWDTSGACTSLSIRTDSRYAPKSP